MNPVADLKRWTSTDEARQGAQLWMWCPGCDQAHAVEVEQGAPPRWEWDGDLESPTISPSILCHNEQHCHSFVRAGRWEFCADSGHKLAGQTVPMVPLPDWLLK